VDIIKLIANEVMYTPNKSIIDSVGACPPLEGKTLSQRGYY